jgi:UDP-N-acetylmuramate dehydrogenase
LKDVSNAVAIRQSKLTPKNWETVVAFLKSNTFKTDFEKIHQQFPEMKYYDVSETEVKSLQDG